MADTGVFDVDQDLIWTRLLNRNLLVVDRPAGFLNYLESFSPETLGSQ